MIAMEMEKKIGEGLVIGFWDRLELNLKMDKAEEGLHFKGWKAALMIELVANMAAMTLIGAHEHITANGVYNIETEPVTEFMIEMHDAGWLKSHTERMMKDQSRKRVIMSSALTSNRLEVRKSLSDNMKEVLVDTTDLGDNVTLYQIIVHEEEAK